jgi:hypothetical protein
MADNTKEAAKVEQIDDQAQNENNNTEEENQEPVAFNIHVVSPKQEKIPLQVSVASVCVQSGWIHEDNYFINSGIIKIRID